MSSSSIHQRLKEFGQIAFRSQVDFGVALGWKDASGLYPYYSGKQTPGIKLIEKLLKLGCNREWLLTGEGPMFADNEAGRLLKAEQEVYNAQDFGSTTEHRQKRILAVGGKRLKRTDPKPLPLYIVYAGQPTTLFDDIIDATIDLGSLGDGADFVIQVRGDSMHNAGIYHGSLLVVSTSIVPTPGQIVVAEIDGKVTVKRLRINGGTYFLDPANEDFEPIEMKHGDKLLGEVVTIVNNTKLIK